MSRNSLFRPLVLLVVPAAAFGVVVDAGSVAVARLSTSQHVEEVGRAAVTAVKGRPVTADTAAVALRTAVVKGRSHGLRVQARTFRLHRDGRLQLTVTTTARTVLLEHVAPLRHLTHVTATATVTPSPYS